MMGIYIQIDTCRADIENTDIEAVYKRIWQRLADIAWRMNVYDDKSEVAKLNGSFPAPAAVGADTYDVIRRALQINTLTDGAFDITVWPLIELWSKAQEKDTLPTPAEVELAKQATGPANVTLLAGHEIALKHPRTRIDLGGIGVGYAIDEAARIFREAGIKNFYIDASGDIYAGGLNCRKEPWRIGVKDPGNKEKLIDIIRLRDQAVTTSGNYERYFTIAGERFSHIIDPLTGYPQKEVISATVIAPTGIEADALATAVTVMGHQKGNGLLDRLGEGYAGLVVSEENGATVVYPSENLNNLRYIAK
jgi:thiamine biosynthesis lipoprotein